MAKLLKLRRGTTSQHGSFTGAEGEVTVDTDKETLVVHDGSTAGGHPVAAEDMANVSSANIIGRLATGSIVTSLIGDANVSHDKLQTDCIDGDNIQDDVINSEHIAAGAVDLEHMSSESVDEDNLKISNSGTNGNFLQKQSGNAGGLTWAAVSTDLVADTTPQLGGHLDVNTKNITFGDSSDGAADDVLTFGAGTDLSIYSDGTNGNIHVPHSGGQLRLGTTTNTTSFTINSTAINLNKATVFDDDVTFNGDSGKNVVWDKSDAYLEFPNEAKVTFGTTAQTTLFHNGTDLYVQNGAGDIRLEPKAGEPGLWLHRDGSVELYDGNAVGVAVKKFNTTATGCAVTGDLTLSGNLTVNGTTTTVATTNTTVTDNLIELNSGATSNANDSGILIERGSTGDNAIIAWDESADKFVVGTTTAANDATGDLTIATGTLVANVEGNVTGNVTGTAATVTGAAQSAITSVGTLTGLTVAGNYAQTLTSDGGFTATAAGNHAIKITGDANRSADTNTLLSLHGKWNGTNVATIDLQAGNDTTNKDNGQIVFYTAAAGSVIEALRINEDQTAAFAGVVQDSKGDLRQIPQNTQGSTYTLVAADAGKHILASGTVTVPNAVFAAGDAVTIVNNTSSTLNITQGSSLTMYEAGTANTGNRTVAQRGVVTLLFASSSACYLSGAGMS